MAWTYSDYRQEPTAAERRTRALLFEQEIMDKITADISSGSNSRSSGVLTTLLDRVREDIKEYDNELGDRGRRPQARIADFR